MRPGGVSYVSYRYAESYPERGVLMYAGFKVALCVFDCIEIQASDGSNENIMGIRYLLWPLWWVFIRVIRAMTR